MNLKIEMNLDNEAFRIAPREEIQNAIETALGKVDWRATVGPGHIADVVARPIPIMDVNGNTVGTLLIG